MTLQEKIDYSIAFIRKAEKLSLALQPTEGFYVGFSGGKDSQAVLELVKMAKVKYRAVYNVTTNDPAENVRFIKNYYPEVEFKVPTNSFLQLIPKYGIPTQLHRWCCAKFKESSGLGYAVITGVRRQESAKRSKYNEITKFGKTKAGRASVDLDKMEANEFRCVGGKDKFLLYPILDWTEKDVWDFISLRGLPVNPCYKTHKRVGCVFCPFSRPKDLRVYCDSHPHLKAAFLHSIERYLERKKNSENFKLTSAEDAFEWWLSRISIDDYIEKKRQTQIDFNSDVI